MPSATAAGLESLRVFLCGGAPVSTALLERARASLPQTDATAYYGTSECGGVTTAPDAPDEKKLTTDGLPLPGMEGSDRRRGAAGPWSAARARVLGCREPDRFRADGWFATGDEATWTPTATSASAAGSTTGSSVVASTSLRSRSRRYWPIPHGARSR